MMLQRYRWFDRIMEFAEGDKAIAVKDVSPAEVFFADHFPKMPVVPGMVQLEGMLQLSRWLIVASNRFRINASLQTLRGVDFRQFVRPGDRLMFEANIVNLGANDATVKARATVNNRKVAGVREMNFTLQPLSSSQAAAERELFGMLTGKVPV
jgi:3-hydroxyacyl-[acyl-carrier-protein] dehydratase